MAEHCGFWRSLAARRRYITGNKSRKRAGIEQARIRPLAGVYQEAIRTPWGVYCTRCRIGPGTTCIHRSEATCSCRMSPIVCRTIVDIDCTVCGWMSSFAWVGTYAACASSKVGRRRISRIAPTLIAPTSAILSAAHETPPSPSLTGWREPLAPRWAIFSTRWERSARQRRLPGVVERPDSIAGDAPDVVRRLAALLTTHAEGAATVEGGD